MKKLILTAFVLCAALASAESAAPMTGTKTTDTSMKPTSTDTTMKSTDTAMKPATMASMKPLSFDEKGLVERLHDDNQREIALAKLAQEKATTQAVKDFAQMMITEHTQADKELMTLATKMKMTPAKPKPATDAERKYMAHVVAAEELLKVKEGPMFDAIYMSNMVAAHDHAVYLTMRGSEQFAKNTELTTMLKTLSPKLVQHREHAYRTLGQVRIDHQMMGTGGAGNPTPHH